MNLPVVLAWLRSRARFDERGVFNQSLLVTIVLVLVAIALVFWLVTSFHVSKK